MRSEKGEKRRKLTGGSRSLRASEAVRNDGLLVKLTGLVIGGEGDAVQWRSPGRQVWLRGGGEGCMKLPCSLSVEVDWRGQ